MARKRRKTQASTALANAKKAKSDHLESLLGPEPEDVGHPTGGAPGFRFSIKHASELTDALREMVWSLYEANMSELAKNSSLGWNPAEKRLELFHQQARYMFVYSKDGDQFTEEPAAYISFRFEKEDTRNIVYCYELQVSSGVQGQGIGSLMMSKLVKLARSTKMEGVMLTVLKANSGAIRFYRRFGFEEDVSSPNFDDDTLCVVDNDTYDFRIMFYSTSSDSNEG